MVATYFREGRGKSINAIYAEEGGQHVATRAAKVVGIPATLVRSVLPSAGWHHVGKYATRVDYFYTNESDLIDNMEMEDVLAVLKTFRKGIRAKSPHKAFWMRVARGVYSHHVQLNLVAGSKLWTMQRKERFDKFKLHTLCSAIESVYYAHYYKHVTSLREREVYQEINGVFYKNVVDVALAKLAVILERTNPASRQKTVNRAKLKSMMNAFYTSFFPLKPV